MGKKRTDMVNSTIKGLLLDDIESQSCICVLAKWSVPMSVLAFPVDQ